MAKQETDIVHAIQVAVSPTGARLWKNTRGMFYAPGAVKQVIAALSRGDVKSAVAMLKGLRLVAAGLLAPGASDLVGFRPVVVTQDMVGQTVAIYSAVEVKSEGGRATAEQLHYIDFVRKNGGFAGVAWSVDEAKALLKI